MTHWQRQVILTIQLPNKRVLISRRPKYSKLWSLTLDMKISKLDSLDAINKWLWEIFCVDAETYSDNYININRKQTIELPTMTLVPYIANIRAAFAFSVPNSYEFKTINIEDYLNKRYMNSTVYKNIFNTCSIVAMAEFSKRGLLK